MSGNTTSWIDSRPGIDQSMLAETLRLSPEDRIEQLQRLMEFVDEVRLACAHRPAQAD